jgi:hypothetical protein
MNRPSRIEAFRTAASLYGLQLVEVTGDRARALDFLQRAADLDEREASLALVEGGWTLYAGLLREPGPHVPLFDVGSAPDMEEHREEFEAHGILCRVVKLRASVWEEASDQELVSLIFDQGWKGLTGSRRHAWLDTVRAYTFEYGRRPEIDRAGVTVRIEGASVVDEAGLFLAVGEGVHGPGGYFGACVDSFGDCLGGGFGIARPFGICWDDSRHSAMHMEDFDTIVQIIRRMGVQVELR